MQLSRRLNAVAQYVPEGSKVIDVGTDHAYIPIYLIKNNIALGCIATDIHEGPLKKADYNIRLHQVKNIKLRLTNGLAGIKQGEADVIIVAGMGGYLIIDILKNSLEMIKNTKRLILQPQQDISIVRRFLHMQGFCIEDETFVEEDNKYYTIISAVPGYERYEKDYEYEYGRVLIEKKTELFKRYILDRRQKLLQIYNSLSQIDSEYANKRKVELENEYQMHNEVIRCIF